MTCGAPLILSVTNAERDGQRASATSFEALSQTYKPRHSDEPFAGLRPAVPTGGRRQAVPALFLRTKEAFEVSEFKEMTGSSKTKHSLDRQGRPQVLLTLEGAFNSADAVHIVCNEADDAFDMTFLSGVERQFSGYDYDVVSEHKGLSFEDIKPAFQEQTRFYHPFATEGGIDLRVVVGSFPDPPPTATRTASVKTSSTAPVSDGLPSFAGWAPGRAGGATCEPCSGSYSTGGSRCGSPWRFLRPWPIPPTTRRQRQSGIGQGYFEGAHRSSECRRDRRRPGGASS